MHCMLRESSHGWWITQHTAIALRSNPYLTAELGVICRILCNSSNSSCRRSADRALHGAKWKEIESWIFPCFLGMKTSEDRLVSGSIVRRLIMRRCGGTSEIYWWVISISDTVSINSFLHSFLPKLRNTILKNALNAFRGLQIKAHWKH